MFRDLRCDHKGSNSSRPGRGPRFLWERGSRWAAGSLPSAPLVVSGQEALHAWTVENIEAFWVSLWRFGEVISSRPWDQVLVHGERMPGATWFPGARLNFAQNLLRRRDPGEALVLSVADVFSALTEDRPYKSGMEGDRALDIIDNMRGSKLDDEAVEALKGILSSQARRESLEYAACNSPHALEQSVP